MSHIDEQPCQVVYNLNLICFIQTPDHPFNSLFSDIQVKFMDQK